MSSIWQDASGSCRPLSHIDAHHTREYNVNSAASDCQTYCVTACTWFCMGHTWLQQQRQRPCLWTTQLSLRRQHSMLS